MMDGMREDMHPFGRSIEVVIQIMDVHIAIAKTSSRCDMEITDDLVHAKCSLNSASLLPLRVQSLSIVFAFALLDVFSSAESPRHTGISLSNFVASIAATRLLRIWRRSCAVTSTAVLRIQVRGFVFGRMSDDN